MADHHVKQASSRPAESISIPYSDYLLTIKWKLEEVWEVCWRHSGAKLLELDQFHLIGKTRLIVINRLRSGHPRITPRHLMDSSVLHTPSIELCMRNKNDPGTESAIFIRFELPLKANSTTFLIRWKFLTVILYSQ